MFDMHKPLFLIRLMGNVLHASKMDGNFVFLKNHVAVYLLGKSVCMLFSLIDKVVFYILPKLILSDEFVNNCETYASLGMVL